MAKIDLEPDSVAEPNSSGITIIIVGLGIAGLTAAVECHRKGHTVLVFEKAPILSPIGMNEVPQSPKHSLLIDNIQGDIFGIGSNASFIIDRWENGLISQALDKARCDVQTLDWFNDAGEHQYSKRMTGFRADEGYFLLRAECTEILYGYLKRLGIKVQFGVQVTEYWEDGRQAGIVIDGENIAADCVIACDGVHSRARPIITNDNTPLTNLGTIVYRSLGYSADTLKGDPEAQWLLEGTDKTDKMHEYIGKNTTILMGTGSNGKTIYWSCIHKVGMLSGYCR
jgi:flavin-dependent dehydrogenase